MPTYRLAYGGRWRASFEFLQEALDAARSESQRLAIPVYVVKEGPLWPRFVAAFPEDCAAHASERWQARRPLNFDHPR